MLPSAERWNLGGQINEFALERIQRELPLGGGRLTFM